MKLIIAGSRNFTNYKFIKKWLILMLPVLEDLKDLEIVSGHARGVDQLGERFATEHGFKVKQFVADWDKYGKSAGYIRNKQMANYADALIAFWDGKSPGTKMMIDLAKEKGLKTKTINYAELLS